MWISTWLSTLFSWLICRFLMSIVQVSMIISVWIIWLNILFQIVIYYIWFLYIFFWVFPRRQIVVGRRFRTLYQFHLQRLGAHCTPSEDGTDTGFQNVGQLQFDTGEIPKRNYTIFKSQRKSEIKNIWFCLPDINYWYWSQWNIQVMFFVYR